MGLFRRKKENVIREEYKDAEIKNDMTEIYDEVAANVDKTIKVNEKIGKKYDKLEDEYLECLGKQKKAKDKLKALTEKHPIKSRLGIIPIIGSFTKEGKEYKILRQKLKRSKQKAKSTKKRLKNLKFIKDNKDKILKVERKHLKKCKKALKRDYKLNKSNIKISKLLKTHKKQLSIVYDKESLKYIEEYVAKVRNGEKDIQLPEGIEDSKAFMKKIESDMKNKKRKQKVKLMVESSEENKEENESDKNENEGTNETQTQNRKKRDYTIENFFAKRSQTKRDVNRDFIAYSEEINGTEVELSPEETVNYVGLLSKKPGILQEYSKEELIKATKKKVRKAFEEKKAAGSEIPGANAIAEMVKKIKNKDASLDPKNMSEEQKVIYQVASKYIEKEEAAKDKQQTHEKDDQQVAI